MPIQNRPGHGRTRRCEGCNPVKVTSPFPKGRFVSPVILPGGAGDPPLPALTGAYSFSSELVESHPWLFRHLVLRSAILLLFQNCRGMPGLISTGISSPASAFASKTPPWGKSPASGLIPRRWKNSGIPGIPPEVSSCRAGAFLWMEWSRYVLTVSSLHSRNKSFLQLTKRRTRTLFTNPIDRKINRTEEPP